MASRFAGGAARIITIRAGFILVLAMAGLWTGIQITAPRPAQAQDYAFSSVRIEGNQRVEAATILNYAGIARGQRVTAGQLNDAYQRLVNSGLFEAVDLTPQGSTLVIKVTEYPTINVISVEGNKRIKDDAILAVVKSQSRRVYSPSQAEADTAAIVKLYRDRSRLAATVTPKIIRRSENRVDLVFEVQEGKVVEIQRLSFVGNRAYSDRRLRRVLASKQAGLLHFIFQADNFSADRIALDEQLLRDFYMARGYVDFRIRSVSSNLSREKNAAFLTFEIDEGQHYRFGKLTTVTTIDGLDVTPYAALMKIRSGRSYTPTLVDNTIVKMENLAVRQGLTFVRVTPKVTKNQATGTIDIAFTLEKGPRIFIERIDIQGNNTTLDRVIREQFTVAEGDPFNPREIRQAAQRIRALGYFTKSDVQTKQGSSPDQVVVDVNVEEQNTGSLAFGGTYSVDSGFGLAISLAESNFLGRGQSLKFVINTASGSQQYLLDFSEPRMFGRDLTGRLLLNYTTTNNYNSDYSTQIGNFSPQLEFPISDNGRLGVRYTLRYARLYSVSSDSSAILLNEEKLGEQWQSGVGYTYTFDTRRTGINPLGGVLVKFSQDISGLGGNGSFLKSAATLSAERRVLNEEVTLKATLEGGAVTRLGNSDTRIVDRFLLGSQTLRGFQFGGIGPRDRNVPNKDALGGNYYAVLRLESDFPLGIPDQYGITGGAFLDMGSLWGLDDINGGPTGANPVDPSAHLRAAIGLSVFWNTPLGPLRFNFSTPLVKESYDKTQNFDVTVSTKF